MCDPQARRPDWLRDPQRQRQLEAELRRELAEEVEVALRVAVLLGLECSYEQIAEKLQLTRRQVMERVHQLRRSMEAVGLHPDRTPERH